ncbi:MAG: SEC-C metal-binding domain-containing protein [bacterium]
MNNILKQDDLCPCGSGMEYQDCCFEKDVLDFHHANNHWQKEEVEELTTETIISRLKYYGVNFQKDKFINNCMKYGSAEEVSELWFDNYNIKLQGFDVDFLWFAAWVLGKRMTNEEFILDEELYELIQLGYEYIENDNRQKGCDIWLKAWNKFMGKTNYPDKYDAIKKMNQDCKADMFMQNWINDLDLHLQHAGQENGEYYWQKKLEYCREVYKNFPESEKSIIKNMKMGEALSHFGVGEIEKGEKLFEKLLEEYSDWPWGYIYWADIYNPYLSWNFLTDARRAYELYEKANLIHRQKEGEDLPIVEERMMNFPKDNITEQENDSPELSFQKEDYIEFCEHDNELVKQWAYQQLTWHFPSSKEALDYTFELIVDDIETFKYDIYKFLENKTEHISAAEVFAFVQNNDNFSQEFRAHLLNFLAQKRYQPDKVIKMILNMFKNDIDGQIYLVLQEALAHLQNKNAYQLLKSMSSEIKINSWLTVSYIKNLLTFKNNNQEDIENITVQVLGNLDKINYKQVFYKLSELYFGREYVRRINDFYHTDDLEEILHNLVTDWPNNPAVQSLPGLIDEQLITAYNDQELKIVFKALVSKIKTILLEKYQLSMLEKFPEINLDQQRKLKSVLSLEDYWITYIASQLSNYQEKIFVREAKEYFINVLISMLIVLKEDIGFREIVNRVQGNDELLWEVLTLSREKIPEQILEIAKKQGSKFEKKALQFIKDKEYHLALARVISYLGAINSNQAVPGIISLVHEEQGDMICEAAEDALRNIDNISLEVVEREMLKGDKVTRLYSSVVFKDNPCKRSAEMLINFHKRGLFNYPEAFVKILKDIGAEAGLEYLQEAEFNRRPPNLDETLYILSVVHEKPKFKIRKYRRRLKKKNKERKKVKNKQKDHSVSQLGEEYIKNEEGTIIRLEDVGRNDPCPCGSGKKYKKCCGQ